VTEIAASTRGFNATRGGAIETSALIRYAPARSSRYGNSKRFSPGFNVIDSPPTAVSSRYNLRFAATGDCDSLSTSILKAKR
jgi:hypothetical protein